MERGGEVGILTDDKCDTLFLGHPVVSLVNHGEELVELLLPSAVVVHAHLEDEALPPEQLQALDELVVQHGAVGLVLDEVPEAPDLGPRLARRLPDGVEVPLHGLGAARYGGPGHDAQAELAVLGREVVALRLVGLPQREPADAADLGQGLLPAGAVGGARGQVVRHVRLDVDEAEEGGRRLGRLLVLVHVVVGLGEGVLLVGPVEVGHVAGAEEVDVGVNDGEDELLFRHGGRFFFFM